MTAPSVREALDDVLSRIAVFRDYQPEEDETWESWYFAAFDLLCAEVRKMRDAALATPPAPTPSAARERIATYLATTDAFHLYYSGLADRIDGANNHADAIFALLPDEAAIRADERERCAQIADAKYQDRNWHSAYQIARDTIAAAIRAAGEK
jgi:hypothetical protein